jgi:hypothetical protein
MPYKSEAQRRWAHTKEGTKTLGGEDAVKEWDKDSEDRKLPEKASKIKENLHKAIGKQRTLLEKDNVIHLNYVTKTGMLYCKKDNLVEFADGLECSDCKMFHGTIQGEGIECVWDDPEAKEVVTEIFSPTEEFRRLNKK